MIFDTNVHLTISDKWYNNKHYYNKDLKKNFDKIFKQNKLKGYACVGISNLEKYDHELFIKKFINKMMMLKTMSFTLYIYKASSIINIIIIFSL